MSISAKAKGRASSQQLVQMALQRIAEIEPQVKAWVSVDAEGAMAVARQQDAAPDKAGPLRGVTIGVKDVVDLAGCQTLAGSRTRQNVAVAATDAAFVGQLRVAGGIVLGKTVTTEYATMDPAATVNPWTLRHTPGGSSSGSAAAVAAGMVAVAIGTQTAGSICRPAAYCGVAALKPSHGFFPRDGVVPLAPSFDTLGFMAARVADCAFVLEALTGQPLPRSAPKTRIGLPSRHFHPGADAESLALLDRMAQLAARQTDCELVAIEPPFDRDAVVAQHRRVMAGEAYAAHGAVYHAASDLLGPRIRELLQMGAGLSAAELNDARAWLADWRGNVWHALADCDAILTLPVPASAPEGFSTTGPAAYLIPWTALLGPLVVMPGGLDRHGLPLATMLAAAPGRDHALMALAERLEPLAYQLPAR